MLQAIKDWKYASIVYHMDEQHTHRIWRNKFTSLDEEQKTPHHKLLACPDSIYYLTETHFIPVSSLVTSKLWAFHRNRMPRRSASK